MDKNKMLKIRLAVADGRSDAQEKFMAALPTRIKRDMTDNVRETIEAIFEQAYNAGATFATRIVLDELDDDSKTITAGSKPVKVS